MSSAIENLETLIASRKNKMAEIENEIKVIEEALYELSLNYSYSEADSNGTVRYYDDGDRLHRIDGPALILSNGDKFWFLHGEKHRDDGPAVEGADGNKQWWLYGDEFAEDEFNAEIKNLEGYALLEAMRER